MFTVPTTMLAPSVDTYSTEALQFNGTSQYMTLSAADLQFDWDSTFTISAWVKPNAGSGGVLYSTRFTYTKGISIAYSDSGATQYIQILTDTGGDVWTFSTPVVMASGVYSHLCISYNGNHNQDGFRFDVNATNYTPTTSGIGDWGTTADLVVGRGYFDITMFPIHFPGIVDELNFFDAVLTPAQVSGIYNGGKPADVHGHANLIHEYRMGEGDTIPTILDHTGSANGITTGSPIIVTDVP